MRAVLAGLQLNAAEQVLQGCGHPCFIDQREIRRDGASLADGVFAAVEGFDLGDGVAVFQPQGDGGDPVAVYLQHKTFEVVGGSLFGQFEFGARFDGAEGQRDQLGQHGAFDLGPAQAFKLGRVDGL